MILALNVPTWAELEREVVPGPIEVRRSRMGYCWVTVDTRNDRVRSTHETKGAAQLRADTLNREDA